MQYKFDENNSGGSWWLSYEDYQRLFQAGWEYRASAYDKEMGYDKKPFSSCEKEPQVPYGWRHGLKGKFPSIKDAIESFESATGQDFFAQGCNCCGPPFSISGDGEYMSGDSVSHEPVRPW